MDIFRITTVTIQEAEHIARLFELLKPLSPFLNKVHTDPFPRLLVHGGAALEPNWEEIEALYTKLHGAYTGNVEPWSVRRYQLFLRDKGFYSGKIDDDHGEETSRAVKAYQVARHLYVDGFVGPETMRALYSEGA